MNEVASYVARPLAFGIAIFLAALICFLFLVAAAIFAGYLEVTDEEIALEEEARKAGR